MDLKTEQKKVVQRGIVALIVCAGTLAIFRWLLPQFFQFPVGVPERIAFAVQVDVFLMIWIVLAIRMVSSGRIRSTDDIRGSAFGPPGPKIALKAAFLQNTLEQAVIAVGAHLAIATLVSGPSLSFLIAATVLFAVGRITFYVGYPSGAGSRAFGMVTTMLPTVIGYMWALYLMFLGFLN